MTWHIPGKFPRNILQVKKKYGENRPSINLKTLNKLIPYNILKLKICIAWNTFSRKTIFSAGSKKCLFLRTTVHEFKKICEIHLVGKSLWVSLPLFWSRACSQPRMFPKLLKAPIALLRWLNIRLVIYLDNIFVMRRMLEEILMSRDTQTDFLLQDLVFLINLKKSVLKPSQQMEFSVLKMDTYGINKIDRSDALNSTVLPACLQLSYLQKQRIKSLIRLVYARKI